MPGVRAGMLVRRAAVRWRHDPRRCNARSAGVGSGGAGTRGCLCVGAMTLPSPEDMQTFLDQIAAAQAAVTAAQAAYDEAATQLTYVKAQLRDLQSRARSQFSELVGT